jgi:hypothetical protein
MNASVRVIVAGVFFLLIFLSGIWLSRTGRPLNVGISTIHKLISLAAGIFLLVTIYQRNQVIPLNTIWPCWTISSNAYRNGLGRPRWS